MGSLFLFPAYHIEMGENELKNNQNMICDLETGVCGEVEEEEMELIDFHQPKNRLTFIM